MQTLTLLLFYSWTTRRLVSLYNMNGRAKECFCYFSSSEYDQLIAQCTLMQNNYTVFSQVRQLSGLAYIPTCRSLSLHIVYSAGRQRPCSGQFFTPHIVRCCLTSLLHLANNRWTCYRFFNFWPWGLTPRPKVTKGETTYYPPRYTILQNFSPISQTIYEICVTNFFHFLA